MKRVSRTRTKPLKTCACGRSFSREEWEALPLVTRTSDDIESRELRNCLCRSTLSIGRPRVSVFYETEKTEDGWVLFRRAGVEEAIALGFGDIATVFPSKSAADAMVGVQRKADRLAAKRLNVELVEPANDTEGG